MYYIYSGRPGSFDRMKKQGPLKFVHFGTSAGVSNRVDTIITSSHVPTVSIISFTTCLSSISRMAKEL